MALVALAACSSEPGPSAVLRDVIETLDVSDASKQCLTDYVDGLDDDHLKSLGEASQNQNFNSRNPDLSGVTPEFRAFYEELQRCVDNPEATSATTPGTATDGTSTDATGAGTTDASVPAATSADTTATTDG